MKESQSSKPKYASVRVPPADARVLSAMAKTENRTVNNMAVTLLKEAIAARKDPQ